MSTFSQDLDFFDISVFKPVSELTKKSPSNVSLKSDFGILEESVTEEEQIDDRNDFSSVGKDFVSDEEEIEEEEKSQSGGEEQLDEEKTSEKVCFCVEQHLKRL